jgi:hypothetical protein
MYNAKGPAGEYDCGRVVFPPLCGFRERGRWWFRVFGWGIQWKDTDIHMMLFSERYNYIRHLHIGNWSFRLLKPEA